MNEKRCTKCDSCSANLCPMNLNSDNIWYPDEEICTIREFTALDWIKNQRKIAKKVRNRDFYFTQEMLERNCIITVATEGLDPDRTSLADERAINAWLRSHPEKRQLSETERENARIRMLKLNRESTLSENNPKRRENDRKSLVLDDTKSLINAE